MKLIRLVTAIIGFSSCCGASYSADNWIKSTINGRTLFWRYSESGDVSCITTDSSGRHCQWDYPTINLTNSGVLTCGSDHFSKYSSTGYDDPNHWCSQLRRVTPPASMAWRRDFVNGHALFWRYNYNNDVQCITYDKEGLRCEWDAQVVQTNGSGTLTCGADHLSKYGNDGYSSPNDWCSTLRATKPVDGLNDTGAKRCFTTVGSNVLADCATSPVASQLSRQDGALGFDASSSTNNGSDGRSGLVFRKICNDGSICPSGAAQGGLNSDWGCTQDLRTGLIWEIKSNDSSSPRHYGKNFLNPTTSAAGSALAYVQTVNSAGLCGDRDWRLPTPVELQGVQDYNYGIGGASFSLDPTWFPEPSNLLYWTSHAVADDPQAKAWGVYANNGQVSPTSRTSPYQVRLVRAGSQPPADATRYVASGADVYDTYTKLTWRRCLEGRSWDAATQRCTGTAQRYTHEAALRAASDTSSYRLPNAKELASIVNYSLQRPAYNQSFFPTEDCSLWTSTPDVAASYAWHVQADGYVKSGYARSNTMCIRLVRSS